MLLGVRNRFSITAIEEKVSFSYFSRIFGPFLKIVMKPTRHPPLRLLPPLGVDGAAPREDKELQLAVSAAPPIRWLLSVSCWVRELSWREEVTTYVDSLYSCVPGCANQEIKEGGGVGGGNPDDVLWRFMARQRYAAHARTT